LPITPVSVVITVSSSKAGDALAVIDPGSPRVTRSDITGGKLVSVDDAAAMKPDVVFAALPHLESARICKPFFGKSIVIDLSADFRIRNREVFRKAYGEEPPRPDILPQAVYGLCEVYRGSIRKADIIANPGCYPTATLLPLIPILRSFPVENLITVNALSGISGAGKKAKIDNLFCERAENTCAYSPGKTHRHSVEIEQELVTMVPEVNLLFTPHLVPLKRGMNSPTVITLKEATEKNAILSCLKDFYADSAFVQVVHPRIPEIEGRVGNEPL
jgi:N-acetyl-gamma-glutamyl-phosphate reductase